MHFFARTGAIAAAALATLVSFGPQPAEAAPVNYTFQSTITTPFTLFGSDPAVVNAAIAALGPNPVISGSFTYDAASPLSVAGGATTAAVYASTTTPSFSNFTATVGGFTFSDTIGFAQVGNNKTFGNTGVDSIQLNIDSSLAASSLARTFTPVTLGIAQVVNVRLFWFQGSPSIPGDFLTSEALPATLPASPMLARISLDFNDAAPGSTLITKSGLLLDGVVVTAVPEPELYGMFLAGLLVTGLMARRRAPRRT
jgi:hypothetical protein